MSEELVQARHQVRTLKRKMHMESSASQSALLQQEQQTQELEIELEQTRLRLEKLERDRAFLFTRSNDLEEQLQRDQKEALDIKVRDLLRKLMVKQSQAASILKLQREKNRLSELLTEMRHASASEAGILSQKLQTAESELALAKGQLRESDSIFQRQLQSMQAKNEQIQLLNEQLSASGKNGIATGLSKEETVSLQRQMKGNQILQKKSLFG